MKILTYEQYSKIKHEIPYKVILNSKSSFLYYFGEQHSFNPGDPQWDELKKFWLDFLKKTDGQKRIVFIEGRIRLIETSEEKTILKEGGMGLATYLAYQENIETYSPEPNNSYERIELEKVFSKNVIQYYYFARVVLQWGRKTDPKPNFEEYINQYLDMDKRESGWTDYDFSLDNMKKVHLELFGFVFDENNTNFFYDISNPMVTTSEINKVSIESGVIRDMYIINEIQKYIHEGYSIFAQYGCSHVVIQEPILRELFTNI